MSMDNLCQAKTTWGGELCGVPATATVVVACKHEHLKERMSCDWHRKMSANGDMDCYDCKEPAALLSARPLKPESKP